MARNQAPVGQGDGQQLQPTSFQQERCESKETDIQTDTGTVRGEAVTARKEAARAVYAQEESPLLKPCAALKGARDAVTEGRATALRASARGLSSGRAAGTLGLLDFCFAPQMHPPTGMVSPSHLLKLEPERRGPAPLPNVGGFSQTGRQKEEVFIRQVLKQKQKLFLFLFSESV